MSLTFTFNKVASGSESVQIQFFATGAAGTTTCTTDDVVNPPTTNVDLTGGGSGSSTQTFTLAGGNVPLQVTYSAVTNTGTVTRFAIVNANAFLTSVTTSNTTTWGLNGGLNSFNSAFLNCSTLTDVPSLLPTFPATNVDMTNMFKGCTLLADPDIGNWNTSNVTNMSGMFDNADAFNTDISGWATGFVTNMSNMFANTALFNKNLAGWNVSNVVNFSGMFNGATAFNNAGFAMPWTTFSALPTLMTTMFFGATSFNADISAWNTTNVTFMDQMFRGATIFNKDISNWNVNKVTTMFQMFFGASAFNINLKYWNVGGTNNYGSMFSGATAYQAAWYPTTPGYDGTLGSTSSTPLSTYFNQARPTRYPCFMKGTQILCLRAEEEVYRPVQDLRKGDLVKTYRNGYLPIHMIGTSSLSNPGDDERTTNRLYKCSKELYPSLFEDLYITGCHSILVPALTNDQWENTKDMLGNVYITDNHFRLMACLDEKAQPFQRDAMIDIYHIALENEDYYMNYGVYANGLLVETCSKRYLTELSNMRIIGEDEACYDAPSVNVFSELRDFIQC